MKHSASEASTRVTILLGEVERRKLLERAAAATVQRARPVSLSETVREVVRAGLERTEAEAEAA